MKNSGFLTKFGCNKNKSMLDGTITITKTRVQMLVPRGKKKKLLEEFRSDSIREVKWTH